jgi:hypothetical protein
LDEELSLELDSDLESDFESDFESDLEPVSDVDEEAGACIELFDDFESVT